VISVGPIQDPAWVIAQRQPSESLDSLAVMKLASRLRSASAALVAHNADPRRIIDDLEHDWPEMLAAVRGKVRP
jgi:hypothetical protein